MSRVRLTREDGVGRLTLSRPEKKNALDRQMVDEIRSGLEALARDDATRVVLLDAEGPDFCAGADLAALEALIDRDRDAQLDDAKTLGGIFVAIRKLPIPVIAAVRGRALAGGAGLASACDIVLAHVDATFAYTEVKLGFIPAMVMTVLRRAVNERQAFELVVTGRSVTAQQAAAIGLVTRVLSESDFDREVHAACKAVAAMPPDAVRRTKRLFYQLDGMSFEDGIRVGAEANADARSTPEFRAGVKAFLATRRGRG